MTQKKRTIPKEKYEENRAKGDAAAAKLRKELEDKKGAGNLADKHIDHKIPIAKGGHPTSKTNMEPIPAKENLKKGATVKRGKGGK